MQSLKQQAQEPETFDVFNADNKPLAGLNTARHAMTLQENMLAAATNVRLVIGESGAIVETRGGMSASLGTILATSNYRGHWAGYLWGSYYVAVAIYDGTKTRIYLSTDVATWTERTAGSGAFGDTRLTGNDIVSFTVVSDPFSLPSVVNTERLLCSDGAGAVREILASPLQGGLTGPITVPINDIAPQSTNSHPVRVLTINETFLNLQGTPSFTVPSSGEFNFAASGSAPNKVARLTVDPTVDVTDNVSVTVGSGSSVSVSDFDRQFLIGVDTAYTMLWDKLKVEVAGNVLWDPTAPSSYARPIPIPLDNSNRTLWVFQYPSVTASGVISGELKFTWAAATNEAPTAAFTADIFLVAMTYASPASAGYSIAVTNANSTSLVESPGVIFSEYVTQRIQDYGGPVLNGLRLPRSPILNAIFTAKVKNVSTTDRDRGVDLVRFYYKSPGAARYRYWAYASLTSVSGSTWSYGSGSATTLLEKSAGPDSQFYNLPEVYLPDAYSVAVPTAKCLSTANDRLFCGAAAGATKNLYISEYKNAFRMRRFTAYQNGQLDADASITRSVGGGVFQAIVPMSSSLLGADTIYIFTSEGIYATGGTTSGQLQLVSRVSKFGTISPYSIAEHNGQIFYLDTEMQVRVLSGGQVRSITRDIVDDALLTIPASYRKYVSGAVFNEKYYLAYTPYGATTNTAILVWDDDTRVWVKDTPPLACQGLVSWFDGTNQKKRLIAFGLSGTTMAGYEYDLASQSQDLGTTNISVTLTTKEWVSPRDDKWWHIGRVGVFADDVASGTANHTRTYKVDGSTGTSSASVDVGTNQAYVFDGAQTITGVGNGPSYQLSLTLSSLAGKRIYRWWCERSLRDRPANV